MTTIIVILSIITLMISSVVIISIVSHLKDSCIELNEQKDKVIEMLNSYKEYCLEQEDYEDIKSINNMLDEINNDKKNTIKIL